jgi:NAD(P) transhydrogenase
MDNNEYDLVVIGSGPEYFRDSVFNYPTLAEAYKVAALDGLNKL